MIQPSIRVPDSDVRPAQADTRPADDRTTDEALACLRAGLGVLILGESGVGKTRFARSLAQRLDREPIVRATLGASDDLNTITSELFGHERGAFSGATSARTGLVEMANGGTLILDEVLNLPPHAQHLLLDFTQFGTYRPLGHTGATPRRSRVSLIAATNGDVEAAIQEGRFREDLYYRLAGLVVKLTPLRERREAIPRLVREILSRDEERSWHVTPAAQRRLCDPELRWAGNVRELEAVVLRARARAIAEGTRRIDVEHLPRRSDDSQPRIETSADLRTRLEALRARRSSLDEEEKELIEASLQKWGGVVTRAANELGMKRTSFISRMKMLRAARWP